MSFIDLDIKHTYNFSRGDKVLNDFYIPALKKSVKYDRATGYFSSASLVAAAAGMAQFVKNGGKYRLIFGREVPNEKDFDAMVDSHVELFEEDFNKVINNFESYTKEDPRAILGWMIKNGFLEVKVCFRKPDTYTYHSKWANMYDKEGNIIHFSGSLNETFYGWVYKPELIHVNKNWHDITQSETVEHMVEDFEREWNNTSETVETVDLPNVLKDKLIFASDSKNINSNEDFIKASNEYDKVVEEISNEHQKNIAMPKPRGYQKEARKSWINNNFKGIFAHATGLGKTYAALFSLYELSKQIDNNYLSILVAPKTLHQQWKSNIEIDFAAANFNVQILEGTNWRSTLEKECQRLDLNQLKNIIFITTYNKFQHQDFIDIIKQSMSNKILIVDEAHNVGSKDRKKGLIDDYKYRLALTATPTRHFDEFGSQLIIDYFGGVCSEYSLDWAIKNNRLSPYYYFINEAELNEEEQVKYHEITLKMMKFFDDKKPISMQSRDFVMKSIERSRIIKSAENKKEEFYNLIQEDFSLLNGSFVFCPDTKFVDDVCIFLRNNGIKYGQITSRMDDTDKINVLSKVKNGLLDTVVGIDMLDEGVDIPSADKAFLLSSSSNPKQFIQRRGRVLRKADNKKYAKIYDFLCFPHVDDKLSDRYKMEKSLVRNQLGRLKEFSQISLNAEKNENYINSVAKEWEIELDE